MKDMDCLFMDVFGSISLDTNSLKSWVFFPKKSRKLNIRVRHRGAVPPGLKKSNLAEFSQGETEKSDLNPEFRGAGVAASYGHETFVLCSKIP